MASPESLLFDLLKEAYDIVNEEVGGYAGLGLVVIGAYFIMKFMMNRMGGTAGVQQTPDPVSTKEEGKNDASENSGNESRESPDALENGRTADELRREEEERKKRESLEELFSLFTSDDKEEKRERLQREEEKEKVENETLGEKKELNAELRAKIDELIAEIAALMDRGLKKKQIAKTLTSRQGSEIPMMELIPLIDALSYFLSENQSSAGKESFSEMNADHERRSTFSALMRGECTDALDFLERAADKEHNGLVARRGDVKEAAKQETANLYQAIGVLARPFDMERSLTAFQIARSLDPDNALTTAMIGRTYYESGKGETAVGIFQNLAQKNKDSDDFAVDYARNMIPAIRTEAAFFEAARIRNDYEQRLSDAPEGRLKSTPSKDMKRQTEAEKRRAAMENAIRTRTEEAEYVR